eukprot:TRINITY_DN32092_c0_g1_i1.p1 TRINITY_DN32092_c0_g1~~TRINITY_DN32092_c0_g1_i1.p1  ORF type:complete len:478 (+),score=76.25 TRINITY_DN32092_c0_g1_i1:82-1515(+)
MLDDIKALFNKFDADGSGKISRPELLRVLRELDKNITEHEVEQVLEAADVNHDGCIDYDEFVHWIQTGSKQNSGLVAQLDEVSHKIEEEERSHHLPMRLALGILYSGRIIVLDLHTSKQVRKWGWLDEHERHRLEHSSNEEEVDRAPHVGNLNCLDVDFPSHRFITGASDHTLKLWDFSGTVKRTYHGCKSEVLCVSVDWPNNRFVTGGLASQLKFWALDRSRPVDTFQCGRGGVFCLCIDWARQILVCGAGPHLEVWGTEAATGVHHEGAERPKPRFKLSGHGSQVNAVVANFEKNVAISGASDGSLYKWDLQTGALLQTLVTSATPAPQSPLEFSPVLGENGEDIHANSIWCLAGDPAGDDEVISGDAQGHLRFWNATSGEHSRALPREHTDAVISLAVRGSYALSGSRDGTVKIWDLSNDKCVRTIEMGDRKGGVWVTGVAVEEAHKKHLMRAPPPQEGSFRRSRPSLRQSMQK